MIRDWRYSDYTLLPCMFYSSPLIVIRDWFRKKFFKTLKVIFSLCVVETCKYLWNQYHAYAVFKYEGNAISGHEWCMHYLLLFQQWQRYHTCHWVVFFQTIFNCFTLSILETIRVIMKYIDPLSIAIFKRIPN